jgi:hypothetical protein
MAGRPAVWWNPPAHPGIILQRCRVPTRTPDSFNHEVSMGTRLSTAILALFVAATPALAQQGQSDREAAAANPEIAARTSMIIPGVASYRFAQGVDQQAIWLDVVWVGRDLDKTAREVRGDLLFYDLSGRLRFGLSVDLQRPISRNDAITQTGIGIAYDETRADHRWLRATPVSAMLIDFRVKRVLFEDGELLEY